MQCATLQQFFCCNIPLNIITITITINMTIIIIIIINSTLMHRK